MDPDRAARASIVAKDGKTSEKRPDQPMRPNRLQFVKRSVLSIVVIGDNGNYFRSKPTEPMRISISLPKVEVGTPYGTPTVMCGYSETRAAETDEENIARMC